MSGRLTLAVLRIVKRDKGYELSGEWSDGAYYHYCFTSLDDLREFMGTYLAIFEDN